MPFIVFEGAECVGKTTQISRLSQYLKGLQKEVICTREPGGTPFAECLRSAFKSSAFADDPPTSWAELYVVAAARAQHLERVVRPALRRGAWVLCDRFLDSAYVYQGLRGRLGIETVRAVHEHFMMGEDCPDLTLVLDIPLETALDRVLHRQKELGEQSKDRLDSEGRASLEIMREGFLTLLSQGQEYPGGVSARRVKIDSAQQIETVATAVREALVSTFPSLKGSS